MSECIQCGDSWPRERMLSLDFATPPEERTQPEELVCVRCASVAMKGGPENMTKEERESHNVVIE